MTKLPSIKKWCLCDFKDTEVSLVVWKKTTKLYAGEFTKTFEDLTVKQKRIDIDCRFKNKIKIWGSWNENKIKKWGIWDVLSSSSYDPRKFLGFYYGKRSLKMYETLVLKLHIAYEMLEVVVYWRNVEYVILKNKKQKKRKAQKLSHNVLYSSRRFNAW